MEKIRKEMAFEIKDANDTEASFWAIASTASVDRDGDSVSPDAWDIKNYKKNPVVPLFHDYRRFPVAKADKIKIVDGKLTFKPIFAVDINPEAKIAYELYKGGFMNAFSVGFMPKPDGWSEETRKDGRIGRDFTDVELLEISAVLVPSNQEALAQARAKGIDVDSLINKEKEEIVEKTIEPVIKEEYLQFMETYKKEIADLKTALETFKREVATMFVDVKLAIKNNEPKPVKSEAAKELVNAIKNLTLKM